jgi:GH18 family chitinase
MQAAATAVPPTPTLTPTITPQPPKFRIVAYATDAIIENLIPYDKLTHINYAFITPNADGTFNPVNNDWKLKLIVRNGHAHNVKVLISVGGWGWDKQFETLAASADTRNAFAWNLKAVVDEYQLDGADIDWEFPDPGQSAQNFLALITDIRNIMPDKLLTAAVNSYNDPDQPGIPNAAFALFDYMNVMTYDDVDHGTMKQFNQGLTYWAGRGLPQDKIVMGVPFYAHVKDSQAQGKTFTQLVANDPAAAQTDTFDFYGQTEIYNGIPTIQAKTKIAMSNAGGLMFWALDYDAPGDLSLVNAIYQTAHP